MTSAGRCAARRPAASSAHAGIHSGRTPCACRYRPGSPVREWHHWEADTRHSRFRAPRLPAPRFPARRVPFRCAPACRDIARQVACREWQAGRSSPRADTARAFARIPAAAELSRPAPEWRDQAARGQVQARASRHRRSPGRHPSPVPPATGRPSIAGRQHQPPRRRSWLRMQTMRSQQRTLLSSTFRLTSHRQDQISGHAGRNWLFRVVALAGELLVLQPVRDHRICPQTTHLVGFVILEVPLEPFHVALALEGQYMRGDPVEEPAVVADDDGAACEIFEGFFERPKRFDVEIVRRFVEQQQVGARAQHLGEMDAVALAAGQGPDLFLLVGTLEVERSTIGARIHFLLAEKDHVVAVGNLFPDRLLAVERVPRLVYIAEMNRLTDLYGSFVGFFLSDDHAEQGRLARPIRANYADDAARRQFESQVIDQKIVTEALRQVVKIDHVLAEPLGHRNGDLRDRVLLGIGDLEQIFITLIARLRFCLPRLWRRRNPLTFALERTLARFVLALLLLHALLLLAKPRGVVALVRNSAPVVELEDPPGHVVEEVAVVSYDQDCTGIFAQVAFEPVHALGVEMVGRFVQQQQLRLVEEQPAQRHTTTLTS